jgi:hypothetical protein
VKIFSPARKTFAGALLALAATPALAQQIDEPAARPGNTWTVPSCSAVSGTAGVTFTTDEGATLTPTVRTLQGTSYTAGLVALDTPNTLLAAVGSSLLRSTNAGCRWTPLANLGSQSGNALLTLTAAPGGRAYAWADNGSALFRVDGRNVTSLRSPVGSILGLAVDAKSGDRLRLGDSTGTLWESSDAGATWNPLGTAPFEGAFAYRVAFNPLNLDHAVVGTVTEGAFVTFDAGRTWTQSSGLTRSAGSPVNVFNLVVSPADPEVVWAMGLDIAESDAGAPSGGRHIYRSVDGGLTFAPVVDHGNGVTLVNGPVMAAHPADPGVVYFVFGSSFAGYGTDLYRYDAATGEVTWTHSNAYHGYHSIAFSPASLSSASPSVMYLGLVRVQIQ